MLRMVVKRRGDANGGKHVPVMILLHCWHQIQNVKICPFSHPSAYPLIPQLHWVIDLPVTSWQPLVTVEKCAFPNKLTSGCWCHCEISC